MRTIELRNEFVRIAVVPELGCKVVSIYDITNHHEWLWSDAHRSLRKGQFGDLYERYDISGFDECFPNIGVSPYPLDSTLTLPDHGDLWSIPWEVSISGNTITGEVQGRSLPYAFRRDITLQGLHILLAYRVRNTGKSRIAFMWSAHPLFKVSGDMKISINGNPPMTKEFGFGGRIGSDGLNGYLGQFTESVWPNVVNQDNEIVDISYISLSTPVTDKVVLKSPLDGEVTLEDLTSGRSLKMRISPDQIPYLGICYNLGAWPYDDQPGTWVAIEPTTGCTDKLDESSARGAVNILEADETLSWSYELEIR